tara:strand:+ start:552 stop:1256 length:705 start_codon:yes stop_codon:yes gene_type:complete
MNINKIYNGDCIELTQQLEDKSIDCVITSPPYFNSNKKYQRGTGFHYTQDIGEPLFVIQDFFDLIKNKLKDEGIICLNLGFSYGETGVMRPFDILERLRKKQGYFVNDILIWHKNNPIPLQNRLTNAIEYIFVLSKIPQIKYQTKEYTHNVFKFPVDKGNGVHSAVFPLELPKICLEHFTKENDLVLDPFMGSGTTALACMNMNRNYIGFEINKDYIKHSEKRLKDNTSQTELF